MKEENPEVWYFTEFSSIGANLKSTFIENILEVSLEKMAVQNVAPYRFAR